MKAGLIVALGGSAMVRGEPLTVERFTVEWENGWKLESKDPIRYAGPGPSTVTIDVLDRGPFNAEATKAEIANWRNYAKIELPNIAGRHGKVVIPLKEEVLPTRTILFSIGTVERGRDGKEQIGLIFVLITAKGQFAQLAVDGPGPFVARYETFKALVVTGRWQ